MVELRWYCLKDKDGFVFSRTLQYRTQQSFAHQYGAIWDWSEWKPVLEVFH